jgi:hypothetical protein
MRDSTTERAVPPSLRSALGTSVRLGGLLLLWLLVVALMVNDWRLDPYDPSVVAEHPYGHNHAGALLDGVRATLVELAVVYAVLRPWSYRRSWGRSLAALALLLPWTCFSVLIAIHAGGIAVLHLLWVAALLLVVVGCVVWSGAGALRDRRAFPRPGVPREGVRGGR